MIHITRMNLKLNEKQKAYCRIPLLWKPRKCKLIYGYGKQINEVASGRMGEGGRVNRERLQRSTRKLLGGDEYVYYIDCGDNFTSSICTFLKHVQFIIGQLYLNKTFIKKKEFSL